MVNIIAAIVNPLVKLLVKPLVKYLVQPLVKHNNLAPARPPP
jgi:hypothetical protein